MRLPRQHYQVRAYSELKQRIGKVLQLALYPSSEVESTASRPALVPVSLWTDITLGRTSLRMLARRQLASLRQHPVPGSASVSAVRVL